MADRSSRLFEIIQTLRKAKAPVAARAIAEALEVSKRTVYRDIVTLQATGVPIEGEAGMGYVMRAGYDLPPLMFTAEEIEAVVVGLSLLGRTGDAGLQAAATRVAEKISDVLPRGNDRVFDMTPLLVSKWNSVPPAGVDSDVLRKAIREERELAIGYRDAEARNTNRMIRPIALVYYVDSVILAAWCLMRDDFRHFRLDRLTACAPSEISFKGDGMRLRKLWRGRQELFSIPH